MNDGAELMTLRSLGVLAATLPCGCALIGAGCGGAETATTTYLIDMGVTITTESPTGIAATTETLQLYPVSVDGKWGFIANTGTIKIEPQYELAGPFSESLALVRLNGKWGFIDSSGTMVIQPQVEQANPFCDGLASVGEFSGDGPLFGYIDKTGTLVIPMQYGFPSDFSEGLCMVLIEESGGQTSGYIDKTGTMVIEPKFNMAGDFSEGLAGVMLATDSSRRGYIDKTGKVIWQGE